MQPQIRYSATEFDIRSSSDGNTLVGHSAVFNSETIIAGAFREQIAPRAFRKSIKEHDVRALFNHDPNLVLGRNKSGTLRLKEDDIGLSYEVDLPDTQAARDLWTLIDRGDVSGIPGVCIEAKNTKTLDLAGWIDETTKETATAGAQVGFATFPRRNHATGKAYVLMTLDQVIELIK